MPMIQVEDGVQLNVQDVGCGPAVVFISGFGLDHQLWDRQVRVLAGAGRRVVCITQRGQGNSDHPFTGYGLPRLGEDVLAVLDALEVPSATLVGHSFGGQVVFQAAASAKERIPKIVLVGAAIRVSTEDEATRHARADPIVETMVSAEIADRIGARHRLIRTSFGSEPDPRVVDWIMNTFMLMPTWSAIECYNTLLRSNFADEVPRMTQPVLQINGARDPVHSHRESRRLHELLPESTLVELDCGHFPMLELPEEFDQALIDFL